MRYRISEKAIGDLEKILFFENYLNPLKKNNPHYSH